MNKILGLLTLGSVMVISSTARADQLLFVAYPPPNHTTTSDKIFLIGTAPPAGEVAINGQKIERSQAGHFAPSFPLQIGENVFTLRYENQELQIKVTRTLGGPQVPEKVGFAEGSLTPAANVARMPGELICFSAVAPANAEVSVQIGNLTFPLSSQPLTTTLPPNSAVLTGQNEPISQSAGQYQGCIAAPATAGNWGQPKFLLTLNGQTISEQGPGTIRILSPGQLATAQVSADAGVARTGPSTDFSRLTPLPKGTQAAITGREGDWLLLDYGGWIKSEETQIIEGSVPPRSLIRGVTSRQVDNWTEVLFPLQVPVPVNVQQGNRSLTLTLYNTTAQTDTIRLGDNSVISRFDWQQAVPGQVQYTFNFKSQQQWGYKLRYEGTTLVLSLRNPPPNLRNTQPLAGVRILLDPGHGSPEDLGARGPNGYPEKDVTLVVSKLLRDELVKRGATVYMTREGDEDLYPQDRVSMIEQQEPNIALSIHYNALPDSGDAMNTKGIGTFWYHPQAQPLAVFLHDYLVQRLKRPSYGVFWNNLALTRPTVTPSVLLELGFMINPEEFEWIVNQEEQKRLASTLADGISKWVARSQ